MRRGSTTVNAEAVLKGIAQGKSRVAIAKETGTSATSVNRFLESIKEQFTDVKDLELARGDLMAVLHGKSLIAQNKALDRVIEMLEED